MGGRPVGGDMREMSGDIMLMSGDTGDTWAHVLGEVRLRSRYIVKMTK